MQQEKIKKSFTQHDLLPVTPLTHNQKEVFHAFHNFYVVSLLGAAGSGKTFLACHLALKSIANKDHKKLVIIRSAVPARDLGFLPGDQSEKEAAYELPYHSIFDNLLDYKSKNYDNLKELGVVNFMTTSYLRGTEFNNTLILLDEAQNLSFQELDTVITRMGQNSKLIICGDGKQADLKNNGLGEFMRILDRMDEHVGVEFGVEDIVRSGVVKSYLTAKG